MFGLRICSLEHIERRIGDMHWLDVGVACVIQSVIVLQSGQNDDEVLLRLTIATAVTLRLIARSHALAHSMLTAHARSAIKRTTSSSLCWWWWRIVRVIIFVVILKNASWYTKAYIVSNKTSFSRNGLSLPWRNGLYEISSAEPAGSTKSSIPWLNSNLLASS